MISIVVPLYNKQRSVCSALQSVFRQTFDDYEVIVIDDGSTDASAQIVRDNFSDSRLRIISQQNAGVSAARNRGIAEAKGEYVAFLDADDEWKPDYLATQMALAEKYPRCTVFAVNYEFRNEKGEVSPTIIRKLPFSGADGVLTNYFEVAACSHPPICSISIMVRKEAIQSIGGFPIGVRLGEDLITWAKLACNGAIAYSTMCVAIYNFASQGVRLIPENKPDVVDYVGEELYRLFEIHKAFYLKEYTALWHKHRMVTFVQLKMRKKAREEFKKIKKLIVPRSKVYFWYIMSFMPIKIVHFFLKYK